MASAPDRHESYSVLFPPWRFRFVSVVCITNAAFIFLKISLHYPGFTSTRVRVLTSFKQVRNTQLCSATRYLLVPNGDGKQDHIRPVLESIKLQTILLVQGAFEVGREPETAEICLPIPTVSGRHALLRLDANNILSVTDLGSTNGTYINGKELEPQQETCVNIQDEIVFGDSHLASFVFLQEEEPIVED